MEGINILQISNKQPSGKKKKTAFLCPQLGRLSDLITSRSAWNPDQAELSDVPQPQEESELHQASQLQDSVSKHTQPQSIWFHEQPTYFVISTSVASEVPNLFTRTCHE